MSPASGDEDDCSWMGAKSGQRAAWLHFGASGETFGPWKFGGWLEPGEVVSKIKHPSANRRGDEGTLRALFAWRWSAGSCPSNTNPCEDITGKNTGIVRLHDRIYLDAVRVMVRGGEGW